MKKEKYICCKCKRKKHPLSEAKGMIFDKRWCDYCQDYTYSKWVGEG